MPRDITAPRRTSRKLTKEEELELKRARGELSCAECKRLKLKCDKVRQFSLHFNISYSAEYTLENPL